MQLGSLSNAMDFLDNCRSSYCCIPRSFRKYNLAHTQWILPLHMSPRRGILCICHLGGEPAHVYVISSTCILTSSFSKLTLRSWGVHTSSLPSCSLPMPISFEMKPLVVNSSSHPQLILHHTLGPSEL